MVTKKLALQYLCEKYDICDKGKNEELEERLLLKFVDENKNIINSLNKWSRTNISMESFKEKTLAK